MTTDRDHLDDAVDRVAQRLTRVEDDKLLAVRIVASLPERGWWIGGWAWRLAGAAMVLVSVIVLQRFNAGSTTVLRTGAQELPSVRATQLVELVAAVEPQSALLRRTFVARSLDLRRTTPDHDRALASLALTPLAADSLPEDGLLSVEPLAIVSLPLATESLSLPE